MKNIVFCKESKKQYELEDGKLVCPGCGQIHEIIYAPVRVAREEPKAD